MCIGNRTLTQAEQMQGLAFLLINSAVCTFMCNSRLNYWHGSNTKRQSVCVIDQRLRIVSRGLSQTSFSHWRKEKKSVLRDRMRKKSKRIFFWSQNILLYIWFMFDIWERSTSKVQFLCLLADSKPTEDVFLIVYWTYSLRLYFFNRQEEIQLQKHKPKVAQLDSEPADLNRFFFIPESFSVFLSHSWLAAMAISAQLKKEKRKEKEKHLYKSVIFGIQERVYFNKKIHILHILQLLW